MVSEKGSYEGKIYSQKLQMYLVDQVYACCCSIFKGTSWNETYIQIYNHGAALIYRRKQCQSTDRNSAWDSMLEVTCYVLRL